MNIVFCYFNHPFSGSDVTGVNFPSNLKMLCFGATVSIIVKESELVFLKDGYVTKFIEGIQSCPDAEKVSMFNLKTEYGGMKTYQSSLGLCYAINNDTIMIQDDQNPLRIKFMFANLSEAKSRFLGL
jgi:hypothetical protein